MAMHEHHPEIFGVIQVAHFFAAACSSYITTCFFQCFMKGSKWINMYVSEYGKYVYIYKYANT